MKVNKSIKAKLYQYFKGRLQLKKSTKGFLRGDCPNCGGKFTFGINVEQMRTKCFKDCGIKSPLRLVMQIEEFETFNELWEFLKIQQEYEAYDAVIRESEAPRVYKVLELPKEYMPINMGKGIMADAARHYLKKRNFDIPTLSRLGVGYCLSGEYMGYIIFPFYSKGKLEFFQGRRFASSGPKMMNPSEEEFGIGKSQLIYNKDALFIYNKIYVVESITNSLTLGERAVGLLGKAISMYQLSMLIKSPAEQVVIMLDPDAYGDAIKLAMMLSQYKRVKLVTWEGDEDVNDLGRQEVLRLEKQFDYGKYHDFFKLHMAEKYETGQYTHSGKGFGVTNIRGILR